MRFLFKKVSNIFILHLQEKRISQTGAGGDRANAGKISVMSPSKLSSAVNYPPQTRQSQAVRLPEGPQLTPQQLQEIEAQFKVGQIEQLLQLWTAISFTELCRKKELSRYKSFLVYFQLANMSWFVSTARSNVC